MKKSTFLASVVTILLCFSLIAGSTFALFTSETSVDIEVDAGRVAIKAGLTTPTLYSVEKDPTGTEYDENGKTYSYVEQKDTFANGGTAVLDADGVISLTNVTPGDKIAFQLTGANTSDVKVQYRYKIEVISGYDLMNGFIATVEGVKYPAMASYTSAWNDLAIKENIPAAELALELPVSAGNDYQMLDAKIKLSVEAVQWNADTTDTDAISVKYITKVANKAELETKILSDEYLHIFVDGDITDTVIISESLENKTIDANNHDVRLQFGTGADKRITVENVSVQNLKAPTLAIKSGVSGDITIRNSEFISSESKVLNGGGDSQRLDLLSVTLENCTFDGGKNQVYFYHLANLVIRGCTFKNSSSWAVLINGSQGTFVRGNKVVSDSTFDTCTGILKGGVNGGNGTGSLSGNFTFANNKMNSCVKKEANTNKGDFVFIYMPVIEGALTFSNNTVNDIIVKVEDMGKLGSN